MRTARWLALSILTGVTGICAMPSPAQAQVIVVPPPAPRSWLHERVLWHLRQHLAPGGVFVGQPPVRYAPPVYYAPPPPPVYYAPPPPPVYYAPPPPPAYYPPPQPYYAPPPPPSPSPSPSVVIQSNYAPPTVVLARPVAKPQWQGRFGLGATFEGVFANLAQSTTYEGFGILGQLRYRAHRHLALEIMSGWQRSTDSVGVTRTDVPLTGGLLIHVLGPEHVLSPYFVVAGGLNFADLQIIQTPDTTIRDTRLQALIQGGAGLELRLGGHFAINGDARLEGRFNVDQHPDAVQNGLVISGKPVQPIHNNLGLRLGVGATVYF